MSLRERKGTSAVTKKIRPVLVDRLMGRGSLSQRRYLPLRLSREDLPNFRAVLVLRAGHPSLRSSAGRVRAQQPTGLGGPGPLHIRCQLMHPQVNGRASLIDTLYGEKNQRRGSFTRFLPTLSPFSPPSKTTTCEMESDQPPDTPSMRCACSVLVLARRGTTFFFNLQVVRPFCASFSPLEEA